MLLEKYNFELFADYHQFYLEDEQSIEETLEDEPSDIWTEQASKDWLAVERFAIRISTARNMDVPVTVEIHDSEPEENLSLWQHVTECSFDIPSGCIIVAGCLDDIETSAHIKVTPGTYRARIFYGDLDALSENGLEGDDHYKVTLWRGETTESKVIKRGV